MLQTELQIINTIEKINDIFFILDAHWKFLYINKQGELVFKVKKDDIIGKVIWDVFPESTGTHFYNKIHEAVKSKTPLFFEQFYKPCNCWFDSRVYPNKNTVSVFFFDITDNKILEEKKDELLDITNHEIKTPLTTISAYIQLIKKKINTSVQTEIQGYIRRVEDQVYRITSINEQLINVSRLRSGSLVLHKTRINIGDMAEEIARDFEKITKHKIELIRQSKGIVVADKNLINQVLTNLISNAVKYSPNADKLIITIKEKNNYQMVSVKDFGIGIASSNKHDVFKRFFRVDKVKSNKYPGAGLGLYITEEIIARHGGKIWVNSNLGKGSTFYFSLPLPDNNSKNTKRGKATGKISRGANKLFSHK